MAGGGRAYFSGLGGLGCIRGSRVAAWPVVAVETADDFWSGVTCVPCVPRFRDGTHGAHGNLYVPGGSGMPMKDGNVRGGFFQPNHRAHRFE